MGGFGELLCNVHTEVGNTEGQLGKAYSLAWRLWNRGHDSI